MIRWMRSMLINFFSIQVPVRRSRLPHGRAMRLPVPFGIRTHVGFMSFKDTKPPSLLIRNPLAGFHLPTIFITLQGFTHPLKVFHASLGRIPSSGEYSRLDEFAHPGNEPFIPGMNPSPTSAQNSEVSELELKCENTHTFQLTIKLCSTMYGVRSKYILSYCAYPIVLPCPLGQFAMDTRIVPAG